MNESYEARWDAESLIAAEKIKSDKLRYNKAKAAIKQIEEEKKSELKILKKLSSKNKTSLFSQSRVPELIKLSR